MSYLTPEKRPIGYSLDRATAERGYRREDLPRFSPKSKLEVPLLALRFGRKKSVVLETEAWVRGHSMEGLFFSSMSIQRVLRFGPFGEYRTA